MEDHPEIDRLPERLEESLRQLGGVRPPEELWQRVALGISEPVPAPEELWRRVEAEVRFQARPRPALSLRRLAAAAAVMAVFGLGFLLGGRDQPTGAQPVFAYYARPELRDAYLSRGLLLQVQENQLSPAARMLAGSKGAALEGRL